MDKVRLQDKYFYTQDEFHEEQKKYNEGDRTKFAMIKHVHEAKAIKNTLASMVYRELLGDRASIEGIGAYEDNIIGVPSQRLHGFQNGIVRDAKTSNCMIKEEYSNYKGLEELLVIAEFLNDGDAHSHNVGPIEGAGYWGKVDHDESLIGTYVPSIFQNHAYFCWGPHINRGEFFNAMVKVLHWYDKTSDPFKSLLEKNGVYDIDFVRTLYQNIAPSANTILRDNASKFRKLIEEKAIYDIVKKAILEDNFDYVLRVANQKILYANLIGDEWYLPDQKYISLAYHMLGENNAYRMFQEVSVLEMAIALGNKSAVFKLINDGIPLEAKHITACQTPEMFEYMVGVLNAKQIPYEQELLDILLYKAILHNETNLMDVVLEELKYSEGGIALLLKEQYSCGWSSHDAMHYAALRNHQLDMILNHKIFKQWLLEKYEGKFTHSDITFSIDNIAELMIHGRTGSSTILDAIKQTIHIAASKADDDLSESITKMITATVSDWILRNGREVWEKEQKTLQIVEVKVPHSSCAAHTLFAKDIQSFWPISLAEAKNLIESQDAKMLSCIYTNMVSKCASDIVKCEQNVQVILSYLQEQNIGCSENAMAIMKASGVDADVLDSACNAAYIFSAPTE